MTTHLTGNQMIQVNAGLRRVLGKRLPQGADGRRWRDEARRGELPRVDRFKDPALDLDLDRVVEMFFDDLAQRDIRAERRADQNSSRARTASATRS